MLIYFVRHGQTDWNKALRWQGGEADNELNSAGQAQARAVRDWFVGQGLTPARVVSSPLKRAMATAECLAGAFAINVQHEIAFKEVGLGQFEGKTTTELQLEYGDQFDQWLAAYHLIAPPGGESLEQAVERLQASLMAHIRAVGDSLVIVAHQAILMAMKAALSGDMRIDTLASYKQANNEIDIWDYEQAQILQRVKLQSD